MKTRKIEVRLTEEQYTAIALLAERRGMGLSTLARTLLLDEVANASPFSNQRPKGTPPQ